jgi:nitrite reductase/ring-hydroxylating ferredoxin subunit
MASKYVVARSEELPQGGRLVAEVAGRSLVLFNVDGAYSALRNRCPHQGAPLSGGNLSRSVDSTAPGDYTVGPCADLIRCPWHGWEFNVHTGESWFDPQRTRVRAYDVVVASGDEVAPEGRVKGPYVAEVYPVSVDGEYVVVEL